MIVPSIDLQSGQSVQLVGGKKRVLEAGDPRPLATRFGRVGEVAVIDLDAAMGTGSNRTTIHDLLGRAPCRVGGGIRDVETARAWLDAGARKVILGTAARPEILRRLPRERVIAAVDAIGDEVVVEGWTAKSGADLFGRIEALRDCVGGFLVTFVEREGRMQGLDLDRAARLARLAGDVPVTVAGGVASAEEIAALDALGIDVQVGMALYSGAISLAEGFAAPLRAQLGDALWPTVVCDEDGVALGLVHSTPESLELALDRGQGIYQSRRRGLWVKGESSGNTQELLRVDLDCDRDCLRFIVRQHGTGFCHLQRATCWSEDRGLPRLGRRLQERRRSPEAGSYTNRLLDDPLLLRAKLEEEAAELAEASTPEEVVREAADLAYFATVTLSRAERSWSDVARELDRRELGVVRRPGDAKPGALENIARIRRSRPSPDPEESR